MKDNKGGWEGRFVRIQHESIEWMEKYYNLKNKIEEIIAEFGDEPKITLIIIGEWLEGIDEAERKKFANVGQDVNPPPQGEISKEQ
jgi:hypothetical protein